MLLCCIAKFFAARPEPELEGPDPRHAQDDINRTLAGFSVSVLRKDGRSDLPLFACCSSNTKSSPELR